MTIFHQQYWHSTCFHLQRRILGLIVLGIVGFDRVLDRLVAEIPFCRRVVPELVQSLRVMRYSRPIIEWPVQVVERLESGIYTVDSVYLIQLVHPLDSTKRVKSTLGQFKKLPSNHGGLSLVALFDLNCCCWPANDSFRKSTFGGRMIVSRKGMIGAETLISMRAYLNQWKNCSLLFSLKGIDTF